jgi:hypothetical protein
MVQKHIIVSMIAPVAIAGILIMAILANQAYASNKSVISSGEKCKTTENENSQGEENCKTAQGENTQGGKVAQESNNTGISLKYMSSTFSLSNTRNAEEKANNTGKIAQESSNTGKGDNNTGQTQPVRPAITLTPIQAHITTKTHMTTNTQQLSNNGILPKLTLAPKPTGPAVAPRLIGAKTIAEVQQLKIKEKERERAEVQRITEWMQQTQKIIREGKQIQFDPKKEICQGSQNIAQAPEKYFCLGKVIPKTFTEKQRECLALARSISSKGPASHSSLRAFTAMECLPSP